MEEIKQKVKYYQKQLNLTDSELLDILLTKMNIKDITEIMQVFMDLLKQLIGL